MPPISMSSSGLALSQPIVPHVESSPSRFAVASTQGPSGTLPPAPPDPLVVVSPVVVEEGPLVGPVLALVLAELSSGTLGVAHPKAKRRSKSVGRSICQISIHTPRPASVKARAT